MGTSDIVSTFIKNNKISDDRKDESNLLLKDFFTPLNENCKEEFRHYYENVRNITQHYGLSIICKMPSA